MWIKICGIARLQDAEAAIAAGADAIGFVFAESPRRVTPKAAREIGRSLPGSVEKIGVFVEENPELIARTVEAAGLTGVQIHGTRFEPEHLQTAVDPSAARLRVVRATRYSGDPVEFARQLDDLGPIANLDGDVTSGAILVDTCVSGRQGGTGIAFDWNSAGESFRRAASHLRLIAAGGLRPENVGEAIRTLQPWGVDVSTGVESSPGRKDAARVKEFIRAARQAASELSGAKS
jgi:phosphoribosylanthranilate isomerase